MLHWGLSHRLIKFSSTSLKKDFPRKSAKPMDGSLIGFLERKLLKINKPRSSISGRIDNGGTKYYMSGINF